MSPSDFICLLLAALIGFAAHRASLCNVRAVAEILQVGRMRMLASLIIAVLWSMTVAGTLVLALHWPIASFPRRTPALLAAAGGFVFGVGAAINGGCSLSTLQRLADGELAMFVTLTGVVLGLLLWTYLEALGIPTKLLRTESPWEGMGVLPMVLLIGLWIWALQEAVRLWRRAPATSWLDRLWAPRYRLSSAAALLGIAGGVVYTLQESWTYTYLLRTQVALAWGMTPAMASKALLVIALLIGMLVSAVQRQSFALRPPRPREFFSCLAGGLLMGLGAAVLPGGNDTLLLTALPSLSIYALANYAAVLAGIASALVLLRRARPNEPQQVKNPKPAQAVYRRLNS